MALGNTVDQLAREVIYVHPALTEVIENALLELGREGGSHAPRIGWRITRNPWRR